MKYFTPDELTCKCDCGSLKIDYDFLNKIEALREHLNFPFIVNSFYRCEEHNKKIGGAKDSYHLKGRAMDIRANSIQSIQILENARKFGLEGIGVYKTFIHLDNRDRFSFWVGK